MSMCLCTFCGCFVDSDDDPDSLYVVGYDDKCVCESCRVEEDLMTEFEERLQQ